MKRLFSGYGKSRHGVLQETMSLVRENPEEAVLKKSSSDELFFMSQIEMSLLYHF
jgi:hypothetical protein